MSNTDIPLRLALLMDPLEEQWPSMDLAGEALHEQFHGPLAEKVWVTSVRPKLVPLARRLPVLRERREALNVDRVLTRFLAYPARVALRSRGQDVWHVVDHTYAQLVHALPPGRAGVYCHDLDAFRSVLEPEKEPRPAWFRAMAWTSLKGLQRAAVVFHSTRAVRDELLRHGVVPPERLVHAPMGVSSEFGPEPIPGDISEEMLRPLGGHPYVLHVGSGIPRKRLDVLFEVFAALRRRHPELRLVQQGAALTDTQRDQVTRLGIGDALLQPPKLDRASLAGLYRKARAVLVTSEAEGFGLPVIEAMACGTPVVASDLPVLREVGGDTITYAPVGDVGAWTEAVHQLLGSPEPEAARSQRLSRGRGYSWANHARTILDTYRRLAGH
ncbi:glycosyltransferase family 4 protein [Archangium lansingense]|uniref:Glycosyltransferase family 1 protein n=1 Tax=Archangium lansingense TaxID=2995310 RepID=A0ABT3ZYK7_9BACT|nr:glycosyltransferase family 1 protein [Archangium lansinium]MCY1074473.1 glycosyltransferase family 1 protein [Archangium lansinium]